MDGPQQKVPPNYLQHKADYKENEGVERYIALLRFPWPQSQEKQLYVWMQ